MKNKIVKRDKAFLGSIIGAVGGVIGSAIGAAKRKKAEKKAFKMQQEEQYRQDSLAAAQAMTQSYANQDYVDEYKKKVVLKNGGKMKTKQDNYTDRIKNQKKYACGGRKKAAFGTWTNDTTNTLIGTVGNVVGNAIAGSGGYTPTSKLLNYKTNTYKTYKPAELEVYDNVADKFNVRKTGENTAKYANAQNNNVAAMNTLGQNPTAAITAVSQIQSPRYACGGGKKVRKRKR